MAELPDVREDLETLRSVLDAPPTLLEEDATDDLSGVEETRGSDLGKK